LSINWGKVQTNVISMVIISIIASALTVVWKGATTVDDKINASVAYMKEAVDVLQKEVLELRLLNNEFIKKNNELIKKVNDELEWHDEDHKISSLKQKKIPQSNYIQQQVEDRLPNINFKQMAPRPAARR